MFISLFQTCWMGSNAPECCIYSSAHTTTIRCVDFFFFFNSFMIYHYSFFVVVVVQATLSEQAVFFTVEVLKEIRIKFWTCRHSRQVTSSTTSLYGQHTFDQGCDHQTGSVEKYVVAMWNIPVSSLLGRTWVDGTPPFLTCHCKSTIYPNKF